MEIKEGYTRVSSILGQRNSFAHINKQVLANKCRIGTNVHAKIGAEIDGIYLDLQPDEEGYFESWRKWWEDAGINPEIVESEERFYCDKLKLTGCVDAIVEAQNVVLIIDFKTSASANKKMWALQAAFYHYLVSQSGREIDNEVWFVQLKKDGKRAKLHKFEITPALWKVCECELHSYRYFNG